MEEKEGLLVEESLNHVENKEAPSISTKNEDEEIKEQDIPKNVPTPLPKKQMFVLICIVLSEGFASSVVLPFIAFMVIDFGISEEDVGYYAGYITSSFFLAQLLSRGRRIVLLIGLLGNAISALAFGFSKKLAFAIISRSIAGLLNGSTGVVKSFIRDITDETNQSKGYMMRSSGYSLGSILGGFLGGLLARPAVQYPSVFSQTGVFGRYPYLLPCVVGFAINMVGFITGYFFLIDVKKPTKEMEGFLKSFNEFNMRKEIPLDEVKNSNVDSNTTETQIMQNPKKKSRFAFIKRLDRLVWITILLYTSISFIWLCFDEIFGVWALRKPSEGGISFTTFDIGVAHAVSSAAMLILQQFIYVPVDRKIGSKNAFILANAIWAPTILLIPFTNYVAFKKPLLWTLLIIGMSFKSSMGTASMGGINILINNSSASDIVGLVNGISTSMAALARLFAPTVGGSIFAVTANKSLPFPFDYRCIFVVLCLICLINCVACKFLLPNSINRRRA